MVVSSECGGHSKEVTEVGKEGKKGWRSGKEGMWGGPCLGLEICSFGIKQNLMSYSDILKYEDPKFWANITTALSLIIMYQRDTRNIPVTEEQYVSAYPVDSTPKIYSESEYFFPSPLLPLLFKSLSYSSGGWQQLPNWFFYSYFHAPTEHSFHSSCNDPLKR